VDGIDHALIQSQDALQMRQVAQLFFSEATVREAVQKVVTVQALETAAELAAHRHPVALRNACHLFRPHTAYFGNVCKQVVYLDPRILARHAAEHTLQQRCALEWQAREW
jgi:hypothetical protein